MELEKLIRTNYSLHTFSPSPLSVSKGNCKEKATSKPRRCTKAPYSCGLIFQTIHSLLVFIVALCHSVQLYQDELFRSKCTIYSRFGRSASSSFHPLLLCCAYMIVIPWPNGCLSVEKGHGMGEVFNKITPTRTTHENQVGTEINKVPTQNTIGPHDGDVPFP